MEHYYQFTTLDSIVPGAAMGYDAVRDNQRRRPTKRRVYPQDSKLFGQYREKAIATAQDLQQNFAVAAWAIRKHLDYVSTMRFQSRTGERAVDEAIEMYMQSWGGRNSCDVRRRHSLRRMIRLAEARRTVDGDFGFLKVGGVGPDRGKLQAIEAYRVVQPDPVDLGLRAFDELPNWIDGVELNDKGSVRRYAIHKRDKDGVATFERTVPAMNMIWLAYYERFDQVRGVSPLLAGMNSFQDVYEGIDLSLAKMKIAQIFGLVFYRDAETATDQFAGPVATGDADTDGVADSGYEYDFGSGPQLMDLEPGDRAEFLEARTPPSETVDFMRFTLSIALKCLDLPDSFLKESETNFFGSRAALMQYLRSAKNKQDDLIECLDEITRWRLGMAIADGDILLPAGMEFDDLSWKWTPAGFPWAWDPVKEAQGARLSIESGLDNIERICALNGTDPQENIDVNARWAQYSRDTYGQALTFGSPAPATATTEDEDEEATDG